MTGKALIRLKDRPRIYLNVYDKPKTKGRPKKMERAYLSLKIANETFDAAGKDYTHRVATVKYI